MSDTTPTNQSSLRFIDETGAAREALEPLQSEPIVGLDTETYWDMAAKCARLSLFQVATPAGTLLVVDALAIDVEVLRPLVESTRVVMAAHNARFDEMVLSGAGLRPAAFVDTLRMARLTLNLPSYSLAAVVEHLFGENLDKTLQKSNWRRRPLTKAQLIYAAADADATLRVYVELSHRLKDEGRLEDVLSYATLAERSSVESKPRRRRRAPQPPATPLSDEEKRIVAFLKRWRMAQANAQRRPAYMVCPDKTLEHLARERPATLEALLSIHGLGESKIQRFGEELLAALNEAQEEGAR